MFNKVLGSVDFGKLTVDAGSGFISGAALILLVDAFTPGHLVENMFKESAGIMVVGTFMVIAGSYAFGIFIDNIYHTFGRWFSRYISPAVQWEFEYRSMLMKDVGLSENEFEWVQDTGSKMSADVEKNYLRATEVAGSSAFALLLLAFSLPLFLHFEYQQGFAIPLLSSAFIVVFAILLFMTTVTSLRKYEMNKTASAMDEIRKLSSHHCCTQRVNKNDQRFNLNALWLPAAGIFVILVSYFLISGLADSLFIHQERAAVLNATGDVPTLEFNVSANQTSSSGTSVVLRLTRDVRDMDLAPLDPSRFSANLKVTRSFIGESGDTILLSATFFTDTNTTAGSWIVPVTLSDGENNFLVAFIKVKISAP